MRGLVPRYESITVHYYTNLRELKKKKLEGFQARVFQHEIDHLNGILYFDRMVGMKSLMSTKEFKERVLKKGLKSR